MQSTNIATGTVTKILFTSNDKQVINLSTKRSIVRVVFSRPELHVEERDHIRVRGAFSFSEMYGKQLLAEDITFTSVTHELIGDFIRSGVGVGEATVERLMKAFPDDLPQRIAHNDIDALSSTPRVSRSLATTICNNWRRQEGKVELISFMESVFHELNEKDRSQIRLAVKKAFMVYRENTVIKLKDDPYRIWAFSTFKCADKLAIAMGLDSSDKRRLLCAVEEVLFKHLKSGSTQVTPLVFQDDLAKILGSEKLEIKEIFDAIKSAEDEGKIRIVITEPHDSKKINEIEQLYTKKFSLLGTSLMENYVSQQLQERIAKNILPIIVEESMLASYQLPSGDSLSDDQIKAVHLVLQNAVSVISGGAGSGKTSVLYCANDIIREKGNDVLQVALSGKASQRLMQQTNEDAYTIASLLNRIQYEPDFLDRFRTPVVHIDEASMVDLHSMYRMLKVFERRPLRLVFIGDWAQLPPVGIGLIFHKLMRSERAPKIELTKNFRSHKGIHTVSECIKSGVMFQPNDQVSIIHYNSSDELMSVLERQYYTNTYNDNEAHIIAPRKVTVSNANIRIHKSLASGRKVITIAPQFREGDKVIYKKNDADIGLVNGSTGTIVGQTNATMIVRFGQEGQKILNIDNIQHESRGEYILQHAYALTCHSAQGSEFDTAIVVVENLDMVERSWLYTAVTRAKSKVIILAKPNAIESALKRGFAFEKIEVGFQL